jgi:hypothetical protein
MPPPENWVIEEWNLFQLARWLGVPPWELMEQDRFWRERAQFFMAVEAGTLNAKRNPSAGSGQRPSAGSGQRPSAGLRERKER